MSALKENLLVQFSVVSFVILAGIALVLAVVLSNKIRDDVISEVVDEAVGHASGRLLRELASADLETPMTGERYDRFNEFVERSIVSERTARVKVWSKDGMVVYSNDPAGVGRQFPTNKSLLSALRGQRAAKIREPREPEHAREANLGTLVEVYTPIIFPGDTEPRGVFEIYQYYQPTAQRINSLQNWIFGSIGIGFLFLYCGLVSIVWRGWRTIVGQRRKLQSFNLELEKQVQERTGELVQAHRKLEEYANQVRELAVVQERQRLARELHDSVTQSIFSMTLTTEAARILVKRDPQRAEPHLAHLQELGQQVLTEMRSLIRQLHPLTVEEGGFAHALRKHIDDLNSREGLKVELKLSGEGQLSSEQEVELLRIAQEALNNVVKHARTDRAVVDLRMEEGSLSLLIEDYGVGFDISQTQTNGQGFGLLSMRERAEIQGGTFKIESQPEKGTRIKVAFPLPQGGIEHE